MMLDMLKVTLFGLAAAAILSAQEDPWTAGQVLSPEGLKAAMEGKARPRLYQVGFAVLYRNKHIAHSEFAGPGSKPEGLEALTKAVAGLKKDEPIVIYCGCCPWDHCPNMRPAFKQLRGLGFTKVKVLSIPTNLAKDWIDKGYPVELGSAAQ